MPKYRRKEATTGRVMYYVDGVLTSEKNIPPSVLGLLDGDMELDLSDPGHAENKDEQEDQEGQTETVDQNDNNQAQSEQPPEVASEPVDRSCLVCGEPGKFKRFLQLHNVWLCDEHYRSNTTGEVVALMREKKIID